MPISEAQKKALKKYQKKLEYKDYRAKYRKQRILSLIKEYLMILGHMLDKDKKNFSKYQEYDTIAQIRKAFKNDYGEDIYNKVLKYKS